MDRQTKGTAGEIIEPLSCNIVANKLGHGTGPSSPVSSFSSDAKDPVEGHSSQVHNIEHKEELVLHIISQEGVESKPIASHIQESSAISISTSTSVQQSPTSDNIPTSLEDEQIINDLPWWYPRCRGKPILRGNKEGLGFACTTVAQSIVVIGLAAFIIPAVIVLAKEEAGCETEAPSSSEKVPECNKKVYGFKPSSLLTLMSSVVGLISACIIPLGGAIVDYTHHRRLVGRITAFLFWALTSMLVFLGTDIDWFPLALIIIVAGTCLRNKIQS